MSDETRDLTEMSLTVPGTETAIPMPDQLPPVGSLWLHRESGERRFVLYLGELRVAYQYLHDPVGLHSTAYGEDWDLNFIWLAWQAGAERIDRETT